MHSSNKEHFFLKICLQSRNQFALQNAKSLMVVCLQLAGCHDTHFNSLRARCLVVRSVIRRAEKDFPAAAVDLEEANQVTVAFGYVG